MESERKFIIAHKGLVDIRVQNIAAKRRAAPSALTLESLFLKLSSAWAVKYGTNKFVYTWEKYKSLTEVNNFFLFEVTF